MQIDLVALIVDEYDPAIDFFTGTLGFDLLEDSPSLTNDGRAKRWVVVRPPGAQTGILLARADGERQSAAIGDQAAGRVGFFLRVDDFDAAYQRMTKSGVTFVREPRTEPYGRVAVFLDIAGNRWDLLGPPGAEEQPGSAEADKVWRALLDDTQGWWAGNPVFKAASEHPELRTLFPRATHGTLRFYRTAWSWPDKPADDLPLIACGGPPYQVISAGYGPIIGSAATAEEAAEMVVANLPPVAAHPDPAH